MEIFKQVKTSEKAITGNVLVGVAYGFNRFSYDCRPRFTAGVSPSLPRYDIALKQ